MQDALCQLCSAQGPFTSDTVSEYTYDMGSATADMHRGRQLYVVIYVLTTFDGAVSMQFELITDDDVALGSPIILIATKVILQADLTAGRQPIVIPICDPNSEMLRYLGLNMNEDGTAFSAGTIDAFITENPPNNFA